MDSGHSAGGHSGAMKISWSLIDFCVEGTAALMPAVGGLKPKFGFHGNHSNTKALKKTDS